MCLGIPGRIESISDPDQKLLSSGLTMREALVSFSGIKKNVNLVYLPEAKVGDYVVVHVGFAISILREDEALKVYEALRKMGELGESGHEVR